VIRSCNPLPGTYGAGYRSSELSQPGPTYVRDRLPAYAGPGTLVLGALGPVNVTAHMLTITEHKITPQLLAPALKGRCNGTVALHGTDKAPSSFGSEVAS